ncbi:uncharacterized protein LOC121830825 [Peromyscus maniculatus bairdii]|uniref:uncharacterized protein LOC121830825 n=1 Tax=Peromyscus maniculatus bairdii TaxID=230844 RepID=UPI003FD571F4
MSADMSLTCTSSGKQKSNLLSEHYRFTILEQIHNKENKDCETAARDTGRWQPWKWPQHREEGLLNVHPARDSKARAVSAGVCESHRPSLGPNTQRKQRKGKEDLFHPWFEEMQSLMVAPNQQSLL